ncbi:MAG: hypothetical protein KatS3mg109_0849 [Pirellulaceae bacterium]|nr:MAG: hypothetical protein KatS3mg109_0849 [Pirellulaceae bacterium]
MATEMGKPTPARGVDPKSGDFQECQDGPSVSVERRRTEDALVSAVGEGSPVSGQ